MSTEPQLGRPDGRYATGSSRTRSRYSLASLLPGDSATPRLTTRRS